MSVESSPELLWLTGSHRGALVSGKVRPLLYKSTGGIEGARVEVQLQAVPDGQSPGFRESQGSNPLFQGRGKLAAGIRELRTLTGTLEFHGSGFETGLQVLPLLLMGSGADLE